MKIFITGGSGYIGRNIIRALIKREDTVYALARSLKAGEVVERLGAQVVAGDITDTDTLKHGMRGCDAVIHCAGTAALWGDPLEFHRVNVDGTRQVILACQEMRVPRLLFISSGAVIADGKPKIHIDENEPYPSKPNGLYPLTKIMAERLIQAANSDSLQTMILRARLVWGRDDTVWLPGIADLVESGLWVWINHGHHLISTCHVDNMVEGVLLALEKGRAGAVYYLTDGSPVELRNFIENLLKTQNLTAPERSIPGWLAMLLARLSEFIVRRFNLTREPPLTRTGVSLLRHEFTLNDEKARAQLGYEGKMTREEGMIDLARRKRKRVSTQTKKE